VPPRLLAHLRRWRRLGQKNLIEFNGAPIGSIDKAFAANVDAAGLGADVVIHTLRHTAITWLAIEVLMFTRFCGSAASPWRCLKTSTRITTPIT
jgi:integrase